ncbi:response regulator [Pleurocapsales cyanobacterium LEGE 06147]|nr:response regulator [Pleurocapsales cyanobacterium LEGE 06147]
MQSNLKQNLIKKSIHNTPLILVVEDDEDNLLFISHALIFFKYTFLTAKDAQTALSLAKQYQPNLILLDIMLPQVNGLELVHDLRHGKLTQTIPIVAVTALASEEDRDRLLASGCNGYLSKPYLLDDLDSIIRSHLPQRFFCPSARETRQYLSLFSNNCLLQFGFG